jgi:uncharacterized protein
MKIVLDSNIIIAAFASRGLCSSLFELCLDRHVLLCNEFILTEVTRVLSTKLKMPSAAVSEIRSWLERICSIEPVEPLRLPVCRDPDDDAILSLAVSAQADFIVTGDDDLLSLKKFEAIPILTPREFWQLHRTEGSS